MVIGIGVPHGAWILYFALNCLWGLISLGGGSDVQVRGELWQVGALTASSVFAPTLSTSSPSSSSSLLESSMEISVGSRGGCWAH